MKTTQPNNSTVQRRWHLVDAKGQVLGRLATHVAYQLSGKGKPYFATHVDCGDFVIVINAEEVQIKGNSKPDQKIDFRHSGYPGGDTMTPYSEFLKKNPERAVSLAVSGMLPKNKLRSRRLTRLKVFRGSTHPYGPQLASPEKPAALTASTN